VVVQTIMIIVVSWFVFGEKLDDARGIAGVMMMMGGKVKYSYAPQRARLCPRARSNILLRMRRRRHDTHHTGAPPFARIHLGDRAQLLLGDPTRIPLTGAQIRAPASRASRPFLGGPLQAWCSSTFDEHDYY